MIRIKQAVEDVKATSARYQRRAHAVREHGQDVVGTGVAAARNVAAVAVDNLKAAAELQKATAFDPDTPISGRVRKLRVNALQSAIMARAEITAAILEGLQKVKDRARRVTDVTHKEQALENRISRKAKKMRKAAQQ